MELLEILNQVNQRLKGLTAIPSEFGRGQEAHQIVGELCSLIEDLEVSMAERGDFITVAQNERLEIACALREAMDVFGLALRRVPGALQRFIVYLQATAYGESVPSRR